MWLCHKYAPGINYEADSDEYNEDPFGFDDLLDVDHAQSSEWEIP